MKLSSATTGLPGAACLSSAIGTEPIRIRARLEPLPDDHFYAATEGGLTFRMHRPRSRTVVFRTDQPQAGNAPDLGNAGFWDSRVLRMTAEVSVRLPSGNRFKLVIRGGGLPFRLMGAPHLRPPILPRRSREHGAASADGGGAEGAPAVECPASAGHLAGGRDHRRLCCRHVRSVDCRCHREGAIGRLHRWIPSAEYSRFCPGGVSRRVTSEKRQSGGSSLK